ncbi:MAG: hypothetical protein ABIL69_08700 [candidate division WOR-3 bacterium]
MQHWISFLVPIVAIIMGCLIAIISIISSSLVKRKYYESVTKAIESGKSVQEIKELLGEGPEKKWNYQQLETESQRLGRYLKNGIVVLGVGLGSILFGYIQSSRVLIGAGVFIGVVGVCFILLHFILPEK